MPRPTLTIIFEHQIVSCMTVSGPLSAGRLEDNDLVLSDTSVSGHHGRFEKTAKGWCYTDLGSSNGSLVAAGPQLAKGDVFVITEVTQILLGSTVLEFDPKSDGPEHGDHGPTTVSFEGQPSADVQRRGLGSEGDDPSPKASASSPDQDNADQAKRHTKPASQRAPEVSTGWPEAPHAEAHSGAAPVADLRRPYPAHPHQSPPPRAAAAPRSEQREDPSLGSDRDRTPAPRPTRTPMPRQVDAPPGARPPKTRPAVNEHAKPPAPAPSKPRLLVVLHGEVSTHTLEKPVNVLGRSPQCDVVMDDTSISTRHAEIALEEGRWMVRDLDSTNGTRQGLIRLSEAQQLASHTHLIVGMADLLFVLDEPADPSRPEPLGDELFLSWLRRRRQLTRAQAAEALATAQQRGCTVGEVLVEQGVLSPGSLTELSHNAALKPGKTSQISGYSGGYIWGLIALIVVAAAAFAFSG